MGISVLSTGSGSKFSGTPGYVPGFSFEPQKVDSRNPDPLHFKVVKAEKSKNDKFILAQVHYPNCTNFKGMKLMIVKASSMELLTATKLDPHFFEEGSDANIVARFRPTEEGWRLGLEMLSLLDK